MKYSVLHEFEIDTTLRDSENELKKFWLDHPDRRLELPHDAAYCKDIFALISQTYSNCSAEVFSDHLKEDIFFHTDMDCEIYQHLRYLPCCWHSHTFLEVVCVLQGTCVNYIAEQKISMQAGDVCIIAPDTNHAISAFSDECILFNIILRTSTFETAFFGTLSDNDMLAGLFMRMLYQSSEHPYLYFHTNGEKEIFQHVMTAYTEFCGNRQYKNRMLISILTTFFITLLREHGDNVVVPEFESEEKGQDLIYILKYMQEHFATVTLKELSEFFNYSERQIQRIIQTGTGSSFSKNIQRLKMNRAVHLLSDPDIPVTAISEELGYADTGNFRHIFKQYYHMTPLEFRIQKKEGR